MQISDNLFVTGAHGVRLEMNGYCISLSTMTNFNETKGAQAQQQFYWNIGSIIIYYYRYYYLFRALCVVLLCDEWKRLAADSYYQNVE